MEKGYTYSYDMLGEAARTDDSDDHGLRERSGVWARER